MLARYWNGSLLRCKHNRTVLEPREPFQHGTVPTAVLARFHHGSIFGVNIKRAILVQRILRAHLLDIAQASFHKQVRLFCRDIVHIDYQDVSKLER